MAEETEVVPDCPHCGGPLKHATVSFGQALPADVLEEAVERSQQCDLVLRDPIGTTLSGIDALVVEG